MTNHIQQRSIKSGRYKHQYLIYCRKSTDDSENQKNSLDHQRREALSFATANHLLIAPVAIEGFCTEGIISESHSGFKEDYDLTFTKDGEVKYKITRPKFNQLVQLLSGGHFAGIICMSWDRLSRNKTDNAIVTKLIRSGIDIQFVTATYEDTSAGALHMDIDGMFAQHHSRVTKEKVTNAMHKLRDDGIVVYKAPLGYQNTGQKYQDVRSTAHKPFDPVRAPIVKDIFEKYATGSWSMSDLAMWANEQGLTNFAKRRPRTKAEMLSETEPDIKPVAAPVNRNNIYHLLGNRFYTGLMQNSQREWISSRSHEALIEHELFERVQQLRKQKQVSIRYKETVGHALRGFVRCRKCTRVYTPYTKKGIQYFGSRCAPGCNNSKRSCNLTFVETALGERLPELFLEPAELKELDQRTDTGLASLDVKLHHEQVQAERKVRKLNEDLAYLRDNRLELLKSGVYSTTSYVDEERRLVGQVATLRETEHVSAAALDDTIKTATKLSELLNGLAGYYEVANSAEREAIMRYLFSELTMDDKGFDYSLRIEFRALEKRAVVSSAPDAWLSELLRGKDEIAHAMTQLEQLTLSGGR